MLCNKIEINDPERFTQTLGTNLNKSERFTQTSMGTHVFALLSES